MSKVSFRHQMARAVGKGLGAAIGILVVDEIQKKLKRRRSQKNLSL